MPELLSDRDALQEIGSRARAYADFLSLPFRNQVWKGQAGDYQGSGVGSSLDFQDHRTYVPGDDPRHINWQAYARSGSYSMKLYREEVRPLVDVILDVSESMFLNPAKERRVLELFYFCVHSALRGGASARAFLVRGDEHTTLSDDVLHSNVWPEQLETLTSEDPHAPPAIHRVPLRSHSMRVLISDLLFPSDPDRCIAAMAGRRGRGIIFAPFTKDESDADWHGNYEFIDVEDGSRHLRRIEPALLRRYLAAYRRHFDLWKDCCAKHGVSLAQVVSEADFQKALQAEALSRGAIEIWT